MPPCKLRLNQKVGRGRLVMPETGIPSRTRRGALSHSLVGCATEAKGQRGLRALVSLILLATLPSCYLEPEIGEIRDGAVHHESVTEAGTHSAPYLGGHGHETSVETQNGDGPSDHEHGRSTDHCTPLRGPACPGAAKWEASHAPITHPHFERYSSAYRPLSANHPSAAQLLRRCSPVSYPNPETSFAG